MIVYYLDASAWVKRYLREPGSDWISALFERQSAFTCSALGFLEVSATLARKHKSGELQAAALQESTRRLRSDWARFFCVRLSPAVIQTALQRIEQSALRGADAVHLASSLVVQRHLQTGGHELVLVASDRELKEAAQQAGLTVMDPEAHG